MNSFTPWGIVPLYAKVLLILALVAGGVGAWEGFLHHERSIGEAKAKSEAEAKDAKDALARQEAVNLKLAADASETARRLKAQLENQHAQDAELTQARRDRDRAVAAGDILRHDLAAYLAAHRGPGYPPAGGKQPPAGSALDLLADLLSRADQRAGELASFADESRARGLKCERDYDSLTSKGKP